MAIHYDVVIVGSGFGGSVAALCMLLELAELGGRTKLAGQPIDSIVVYD